MQTKRLAQTQATKLAEGGLVEARLSRAEWMDRFGEALMRLQPAMNAVTAGANAVDAYADGQDVEPEDAARSWVDECGPDDCRPA